MTTVIDSQTVWAALTFAALLGFILGVTAFTGWEAVKGTFINHRLVRENARLTADVAHLARNLRALSYELAGTPASEEELVRVIEETL